MTKQLPPPLWHTATADLAPTLARCILAQHRRLMRGGLTITDHRHGIHLDRNSDRPAILAYYAGLYYSNPSVYLAALYRWYRYRPADRGDLAQLIAATGHSIPNTSRLY